MEQAGNDAIIRVHSNRMEFITGRRSIDMHHTTNTSRTASMSELRYEYREWLYKNNFPKMSAGNLLNEGGSQQQATCVPQVIYHTLGINSGTVNLFQQQSV